MAAEQQRRQQGGLVGAPAEGLHVEVQGHEVKDVHELGPDLQLAVTGTVAPATKAAPSAAGTRKAAPNAEGDKEADTRPASLDELERRGDVHVTRGLRRTELDVMNETPGMKGQPV